MCNYFQNFKLRFISGCALLLCVLCHISHHRQKKKLCNVMSEELLYDVPLILVRVKLYTTACAFSFCFYIDLFLGVRSVRYCTNARVPPYRIKYQMIWRPLPPLQKRNINCQTRGIGRREGSILFGLEKSKFCCVMCDSNGKQTLARRRCVCVMVWLLNFFPRWIILVIGSNWYIWL